MHKLMSLVSHCFDISFIHSEGFGPFFCLLLRFLVSNPYLSKQKVAQLHLALLG